MTRRSLSWGGRACQNSGVQKNPCIRRKGVYTDFIPGFCTREFRLTRIVPPVV